MKFLLGVNYIVFIQNFINLTYLKFELDSIFAAYKVHSSLSKLVN